MVGSLQTRQLGSACRIYKNVNGKILALDDISIVADTRKVADGRWHKSAYLRSHRTLFALETGNRTITTVQMIGDYDSITENSGDYLEAVWTDESGDNNDVTISFSSLKKTGDTV